MNFVKELIGGPSDFAVGWIIILLASLVGLLEFTFGLFGRLINYLRRDAELLKNIARLATTTNISYFKELLGNPAFINHRPDDIEFIFVREKFYVQAITDSNETVLRYSVTTRSKYFTPCLSLGPFAHEGGSVKIKLGRSSFLELDIFGEPEEMRGLIGANWYFYSEVYYFGRPGKYLRYSFGLNEAGYSASLPNARPDIFNTENLKRESLVEFRKTATINTYTIISDSNKTDETNSGPDYNKVRVIEL